HAPARPRGRGFSAPARPPDDPRITGGRGEGLPRGIASRAPAAPAVTRAALEAGFLLNAPDPSTLRLAPPLIITEAELATFTAALPGLLDAADTAEGDR